MTDSKEWALKELENANTIFEPYEMSRSRQFVSVVVWFVEITIVAYAAFRFFS